VICDIQTVCDVFRLNKGWKLEAANSNLDLKSIQKANWNATVVAVVGLYNKGKTTVLNLMTGTEFQALNTIRTKGISFKLLKTPPNGQLILLDTAGMYSPVTYEDVPKEAVTDSTTETATENDRHFANLIAEKKATEHFLQELIFEISDVLIVVVDNLTVLDQEYLQTMHMKITRGSNINNQKIKKFYIVHNFRDTTNEKEALARWKEQVLDIYKTGKQQTISVVLESRTKSGTMFKTTVQYFDSPIGRHVFILQKDSLFGSTYNIASMESLKSWIAAIETKLHRSYNPLEVIRDTSNDIIRAYIDNAQTIQLSESKGESGKTEFTFTMKKGQLDPQLKSWRQEGFTIIFDPTRRIGDGKTFVPKFRTLEKPDHTKLFLIMDLPGCNQSMITMDPQKTHIKISGMRDKVTETQKITGNEVFVEEPNEIDFGAFEKSFQIDSKYDSVPKSATIEDGVFSMEFHPFHAPKPIDLWGKK